MAGSVKRRKSANAREPNNLTIAVFLVAPVIAAFYSLFTASLTRGRDNIPPSGTPKVLVVEGHTGLSGRLVNGEYQLELSLINGRPSWARRQRGVVGLSSAYLFFGDCGGWQIASHHRHTKQNCTGWVISQDCGDGGSGAGPWDCTGRWRKWSRDGPVSEGLAVTKEARLPALGKCSMAEEETLRAEVHNIDLVLPWVNGSDPAWLRRRAAACEEFFGQLWEDAQYWSPPVRACLQDAAANRSEHGLCGPDGECSNGLLGDPGGSSGPSASECFRQHLRKQCGSRLHSIRDHDELRYLVRSVERNLRWHTGRILLVVPQGQRPRWLDLHGRLQLVSQEDLLQAAMRSDDYDRRTKGRSAYAPGRIFNNEAIMAALPFLPGASRFMIVLEDDLFLPRAVTACELFTRPPRAGVRLFSRAVVAESVADPYSKVYAAAESWTARLWERHLPDRGVSSPYYQPQHAPWILDADIIRDLWRRWPRELSRALDAPFRHPNQTDVVGLHHSEVVLQGREARRRLGTLGWWGLLSSLVHDPAFVAGEAPGRSRVEDVDNPGQTIVKEAVFRDGTAEEWEHVMEQFHTNQVIPAAYSLQDDYSGPVSQQQTCLRERWLNRLLPVRSSFEASASPPSGCNDGQQRTS